MSVTESNTNRAANAESQPTSDVPPAAEGKPPEATAAVRGKRRRIRWIVIGIGAVAALVFGVPWVIELLSTVSTDDAYVNGHVTFVAPRVAGQVARVLVDDNNRVKKGDVLVQLDREPFEVQVRIARAAVDSAQADLIAKRAETRGVEGRARSLRYALQRAIEDVDNQIALLRSKVAVLQARKATLENAKNEYNRVHRLYENKLAAKQEMDDRIEQLRVAEARVDEGLEDVHQIRVSLGLPPEPVGGGDLGSVPPDLDQTFSGVRQAQASLIQTAAELGVMNSFNKTPQQMLDEFYRRDPSGDIDKIYAALLEQAPAVKQAETKLFEAQRNLDQAELNLRYCDVISEIDGVVTRREVNPGNNVIVGQSLLAVRSLTEIWIDANFKETQLAELRIGQPVDLHVDMYGRSQMFKGRISGFTMGTGSTLALLPAENATGNFVKVVQRLPVRIEVLNYDPDKLPLFVGLSVEPRVRLKEKPTGENAGKFLQPFLMPTASAPVNAPANANSARQ